MLGLAWPGQPKPGQSRGEFVMRRLCGYLAAACLALLAGTGSADTPDMSAGTQYMPPVAAQFYTFWRQAYGRPFA